jgi:hypothetical protein
MVNIGNKSETLNTGRGRFVGRALALIAAAGLLGGCSVPGLASSDSGETPSWGSRDRQPARVGSSSSAFAGARVVASDAVAQVAYKDAQVVSTAHRTESNQAVANVPTE